MHHLLSSIKLEMKIISTTLSGVMMGSHDNGFKCNYTILFRSVFICFSAICAPLESFQVAPGCGCGFLLSCTTGSFSSSEDLKKTLLFSVFQGLADSDTMRDS